ncbi:MAG TPA: ATP-binding protein [Rectinemataceae bacterium]|nr:ATP-binding protein [Rectinemataceae bacterium]
MVTKSRILGPTLERKLRKPFVHILFGARQTGKSTLLRSILPEQSTRLDLSDPRERARFAANPGLFIDLCRSLPLRENGWTVFVDEAQSVPALFDAVQNLYDSDKERWRFVLCGSSARRLRVSGANLLPGRSMRHVLHPLVTEEYEAAKPLSTSAGASLVSLESFDAQAVPRFPGRGIESRLVFGDLPGIALLDDDGERADILTTYATAYLEEEIRRETLVKDWGHFLRFLKFAAGDSGGIVNLAAVSRETGVAAQTIKAYYQLLEDMFIGFSVPAFSGSARKSALSSPRFFFFDLGVRNAAAGLPLVEATVNAAPGLLFEHWVGVQLMSKLSYQGSGGLSYYRTTDGAEVDFVLEQGGELTPIEVKWSENPSLKDARHLKAFIIEHSNRCTRGYIVSRCPYVLALDERIMAIPWWMV